MSSVLPWPALVVSSCRLAKMLLLLLLCTLEEQGADSVVSEAELAGASTLGAASSVARCASAVAGAGWVVGVELAATSCR